MTTTKPVGFAGIGNMGAPMVRCLAKAGISSLIFDVNGAATEPFAKEGGPYKVARDLAEVGAGADVVVTMLPDSKIVRAAVMGGSGRKGLVDGLKRGAVIIDMSSSFPPETQRLGDELAERGIGLVDAPVSGGVPKAVTGTLAIMAGGDGALIDRVEPVLKAMGTIYRTGPLGSGHAMKALNNYVSAAGLIATSEALVIGERFGLSPKVMNQILNASTGRNNTTENKVDRYMLSRAFNSGFALALMRKDVGMARKLADTLGITAEELGLVSEILDKAEARLASGADHTAVYQYVEDAARKTKR
jgi:3-hydroxyisobutyrate dehydrogenase